MCCRPMAAPAAPAITGGWVALRLAMNKLLKTGAIVL